MPQSPVKVDAIVLAGTHQDKRRLIAGQNKAFLPLGERICLELILEALGAARRVGRIFVVGPEVELRRRVPPERWGQRIVPESGRMLDNAWKAFAAAEESAIGLTSAELERRPYLFLTSDIPLAVSEAIDDYVERCFMLEEERGATFDFLPGLADEAALAPFYPRTSRRGIRRPYMELKHQRLRLANIHLARPRRIRNLEILQQGFSARKLTQWWSVGRLIGSFLRNPGGIRGACHVACFQAASVLERHGWSWFSSVVRNSLDLAAVERSASAMLGCGFAAVITPFGGLSLDMDEESDYEIIRENLLPWTEHQRTLLAAGVAPRAASAVAETAAGPPPGGAPAPPLRPTREPDL
ncbi:MAG TPA: hypothetical protein VGR67_03270 [Candidatus Polarisedimenticolia bacterium]|nr:hypothetical protein [Candidatus Polarisedimenticolia bacterium]